MADVKGKITLEISDDYLSAFLLYTPDEGGKLWTPSILNDFLDEEGVTFGIKDEVLLQSFKNFAEKKSFKSDIIAIGQAPELPRGESFLINEIETADFYLSLLETVLEKTPPPEIFEIPEGKAKGGAFKKEEKNPLKIPVKINPSVIQTGYYRKDEIVGTILSASAGKAGISISGHEIPPGKPDKSIFHLGPNLKKERNGEVRAERSGFFRLGDNWADLIPLNDHQVELSFSKDRANCLLTLTPGMKEIPPPEISLIHRLLDDAGYDRKNVLSDKKIETILKKIISIGKKITTSLSINQDAEIDIRINETETEAELFLKKGTGKGVLLDLNSISTALNRKKLKGVNIAQLKQQISDFYFSSEMKTTLPLCKGKRPERGKDRSINFSVEFQDESFLQEVKQYLTEHPEPLSSYPSIKDFPMEKVEKVAKVQPQDRLFTISGSSKGKDGLDVFGNIIPGMKGNDPDLHLFEGIDYQEGVAKAQNEGLLEILHDQESNILFARIREHKDAEIQVFLSENLMQATIHVNLPSGSGLYANPERIMKALDDAEVFEGILKERIDEASEISQKGEVLMDFLIAEGKYPMEEDRELRLFHDIDHQKRNSAPVKKGEKIGEIVKKADDHSSGYNVHGEKLESNPKDSIKIGDNVSQSEPDEKGIVKLTASASGQLFFDGTHIFIKDTLKIEGDFNPTMGRAVFPGNIYITGSVQSQSVVKAGENIQVDQVVESALLSADGYIVIKKGVKGNKKAAIRAQHHVRLGYAEETNIMAVESINVDKALYHCQIKCNGRLLMESGAKILGGNLKIKSGLETDIIGSERGANTVISFGQDYLVEDQIGLVEKDIKKIQEQMMKIDAIIQKIQEQGGKNEVLLEAREKKRKALKMVEKKNLKLFLLREKFEMHFDSSILVREKVFAGTLFESHGRSLEIPQDLQSVEIFFDQSTGKISHKPL